MNEPVNRDCDQLYLEKKSRKITVREAKKNVSEHQEENGENMSTRIALIVTLAQLKAAKEEQCTVSVCARLRTVKKLQYILVEEDVIVISKEERNKNHVRVNADITT